ncbi:tRNA (N6-threonylcarbamoyladenosine(37)-N6)-methyltransferase TrmO [Acinetobacter populi]|uniref:tRNA (N6-threonylcarbamoyladenosine(37)-N6)-methyltransferase TrmO n=1 Tax=Acinetobacter populi TaxID=1582270 RepID=A0A1Z9YXQ5_9GAMM|nr:tRNA (N6-threonylcarbamoyladenosine(37)-N6)-methyltransferase TrmO [Acinetobacter populi]OUY06966.1 tRNA (N6-threonylcarbamoyladenosine(37)-N6)-methyltransferase TrmO [Acinetobacter populi]
MMNNVLLLPVIGYMHSPFIEKFGIPRQPNLVNSISYVVMNPPYDDLSAFIGIEQFSHIWLLWQFHDNKRKNHDKDFQPLIRPPRLGGNQKIGIFASRSMYRPAPVGLSVVQLIEVKRVGKETRVYVKGSDLLNGTPIIDIKPYLVYGDAVAEAKSGYAQEAPLLLAVLWQENAREQQQRLLDTGHLTPAILSEIEQVVALNPKPAYQTDESKIYGLSYAHVNVKFRIFTDHVEMISIELIGAS